MDVVAPPSTAAPTPTGPARTPTPPTAPVMAPSAAPTGSRTFAEARPNGAHAYAAVTIGPDQISVVDVTLTRNGREDRDLRAVERLDITFRKWPGTVPVVVRLVHTNGTAVAIAASHRVEPCRDLIESLQREVGSEHVQVRGAESSAVAPAEVDPWGGRVSA